MTRLRTRLCECPCECLRRADAQARRWRGNWWRRLLDPWLWLCWSCATNHAGRILSGIARRNPSARPVDSP